MVAKNNRVPNAKEHRYLLASYSRASVADLQQCSSVLPIAFLINYMTI